MMRRGSVSRARSPSKWLSIGVLSNEIKSTYSFVRAARVTSMRDDCPQLKLSRESVLGAWDAIETVEPIHGHLSMFFRASCRATSGVAPPFVAISKAAPIEVQNLPICGMFGITTPFSAFS